MNYKEKRHIRKLLGRKPNETETAAFEVMYSEHCSYKSSKIYLNLLPHKAKYVIYSFGENAGVIDIGDNLAVAFKVESHNHPSGVEPKAGAATGIGGILRDILAVGARPIALLNSLRFGLPESPKTKFLLKGVVDGISSYGNCVGVPTVGGEVYFDPSYQDNPLVNVFCLGIAEKNRLISTKNAKIGDYVICIGNTTGRDGIGGVTFASQKLAEEAYKDRPAVQIGDPFFKKKLIEASLELIRAGVINAMQDLGGAGLICGISEISTKSDCGMNLDLSKMPFREEGMLPWEIVISESQERMLITVRKEHISQVKAICDKWDIHFANLGRVIKEKRLILKDKGKVVASIPPRALTEDVPKLRRRVNIPNYLKKSRKRIYPCYPKCQLKQEPSQLLLNLLKSPNIANKHAIYEQYDYMVGINTLIPPGEGDAAVLRIKEAHNKAVAISMDGNGRYTFLSPFYGGAQAVCEAARNVSCTGAVPLAFSDCLNFASPENPDVMWQFKKCIEGMRWASNILNLPFVSGNVSFYNESEKEGDWLNKAIIPTPVVSCVGLIEGYSPINAAFKREKDLIFIIGEETKAELGGSELCFHCCATTSGIPPKINIHAEAYLYKLLKHLAAEGLIESAHDTSEGGLAVALAESAILGKLGVNVNLAAALPIIELLFAETQSRIIISIKPENFSKLQTVFYKIVPKNLSISLQFIGETKREDKFDINIERKNIISLKLKELEESWNKGLCF